MPNPAPGDETLARLLQDNPVPYVDNRCFCQPLGWVHVRGVDQRCQHHVPVIVSNIGQV